LLEGRAVLTALLIMLREGFEAALVVAIVYAYIGRIGRRDLVAPMWRGMAAAAALSVGAGIAVHLTVEIAVHLTFENLTGEPRLLAFAAVSLLAVAVLTWMIFWMRRQAHLIRGELQHSVDQAIAGRDDVRFAVMTVAFLAVAREGLEAALFLIAAATTEEGWAVLVGGLIGLAAASVLGALVVLGGRRLPMRQFFTVTGLILIVFAAGLVSRTVLWLQAAGELGTVWNNVYDLTAYRWLTVSTESGRFLGAMFGWDPRPSIEQVVAYLLFLVTVTWLFLRTPRPGQGGVTPKVSRNARSSA
jgi:high-affinity iron transporter